MHAPSAARDVARRLRRDTSLPEGLLWRAIKGRKLLGFRFRRQHPMGPYVLDFYCRELMLCVEIDGASHSLGDQPQRDVRRDRWLAARGVRTVRLSASSVLEDVDDAVGTIIGILETEGVARAPSVAFGDTSPGGGRD
ncbi:MULTISPECIES: endonuclease domain-containing protein [unclassified Phenylobacterium]|uniref:endonuclease domain-containing protein n=1 Tax=unclassified Phenylobacterium TaxID=2640670 RepID=UPI0009EC7CA2|nr:MULTISPECIES: endonuclease domain-containing protein [unclassified Phenylobacterium]